MEYLRSAAWQTFHADASGEFDSTKFHKAQTLRADR